MADGPRRGGERQGGRDRPTGGGARAVVLAAITVGAVVAVVAVTSTAALSAAQLSASAPPPSPSLMAIGDAGGDAFCRPLAAAVLPASLWTTERRHVSPWRALTGPTPFPTSPRRRRTGNGTAGSAATTATRPVADVDVTAAGSSPAAKCTRAAAAADVARSATDAASRRRRGAAAAPAAPTAAAGANGRTTTP